MIGPSSHISKLLLSLFFLLLVFYVAMDVSMYLRIQNYPISRDLAGNGDMTVSSSHDPKNSTYVTILQTRNNYSNPNATRKEYFTEVYKSIPNREPSSSSDSIISRSVRFVNQEPQIDYETVTWITCDINPLCYPTVKALMLDHTNHYLFAPLVSILDVVAGISENMPYITPNAISYSHVVLAMIAGKLISVDCLAYRRLGVVLFQVRTFMDDLDGHVARARKHIHGERSEVGTAGYYVDGVCDLLGCVFLIIGLFYYLKNNPPRRGYVKVHTLLPHFNENDPTKEPIDANGEVGFVYKPKVSTEKMVRKVLMFSGQLMLSSMSWNRYIDVYQDALESDDENISTAQRERRLFVFRSGFFFSVAWLWKIVNVHSFLHCILFAIFCDKLWEFLRFIQFSGYAVLVASVCFTEMHVMKVQNYVYKMFVYNNGAPS